jgi:hypothetical protein
VSVQTIRVVADPPIDIDAIRGALVDCPRVELVDVRVDGSGVAAAFAGDHLDAEIEGEVRRRIMDALRGNAPEGDILAKLAAVEGKLDQILAALAARPAQARS